MSSGQRDTSNFPPQCPPPRPTQGPPPPPPPPPHPRPLSRRDMALMWKDTGFLEIKPYIKKLGWDRKGWAFTEDENRYPICFLSSDIQREAEYGAGEPAAFDPFKVAADFFDLWRESIGSTKESIARICVAFYDVICKWLKEFQAEILDGNTKNAWLIPICQILTSYNQKIELFDERGDLWVSGVVTFLKIEKCSRDTFFIEIAVKKDDGESFFVEEQREDLRFRKTSGNKATGEMIFLNEKL